MSARSNNPAGSVLPIVAISITVLLLMLAIGFDLGWIYLVKNELQNAADAAALAGASQLPDEDFLFGAPDISDDIVACRDYAETYAGYNPAARRYITLDRNDANDPDGGVVVGYIEDPMDINSPLQTQGITEYNSVRVAAQLTQSLNGPLQLFFGALTGVDNLDIGAMATATIDDRVIGFALKEGETLWMLPFTVNVDLWDEGYPGDPIGASFSGLLGLDILRMLAGIACHESGWYSGVLKLYPYESGPGNFGTVDVGPPNNSTSDLIRQIRYGISPEDLEAIGGLILTDDDDDGVFTKWLEGDTGLSTALRSAIEEIIDQPRIIPLYRDAYGSGNNRMFEIVRFAGVRVVDVVMTGPLWARHIDVVPHQITTAQALIHRDAPGSNLVYALSLTR